VTSSSEASVRKSSFFVHLPLEVVDDAVESTKRADIVEIA
jgi:hypothetical protein